MLHKQLNIKTYTLGLVSLLFSATVCAEILPEAEVGIKIPLVKKPTTRPITVAHMPLHDTYYVADGGLAPLGSQFEPPISKSEIHAFKSDGSYINSAKPGYDNRSIYFNPNTGKLETVTYNISAEAGFAPNTGIFSLDVGDKGEIKITSDTVSQFNSAFGSAATIPSYDPVGNQYYAKQERSNIVLIVDTDKSEPIGKIELDLKTAGALMDGIGNHYIAYSGVKGEELVLLDVDHKAALVFDLKGKFIGKSALPKNIKLRAQNHFNGLGYANGMMFVFHEREGEFGTYYGLKVLK